MCCAGRQDIEVSLEQKAWPNDLCNSSSSNLPRSPLSLADLFALKFHLALLIIGLKTAYKVYRAQLLAALATGYQCVESVTYFRFL